MDPVTLTLAAIAASWGVGKMLDVVVLRMLPWMTREVCASYTHLQTHQNPVLRLAGELAREASRAKSDKECQRRFHIGLLAQQQQFEALRDCFRDDEVWKFDLSQDVVGIQGNLERVLSQLCDFQEEFRDFAKTLADRLGLKHLHHRLEIVHAVLTSGLCQPALAWQRYWERMRTGIPSSRIREKAAYTVITSFVGREEDTKRFIRFLDNDDEILHTYGEMGTGKSRFLHECAAQAERRNWMVRFVSEPVSSLNLGGALEAVRSEVLEIRPTGLLLIWDDWQGENEEAIDLFLKSSADLPGTVKGVRVKR
ncbi:MAG: ATP-binding protein, partial [Planctomycetes bacterium]|nr:ATP-binding protein [Planctomycetota bacterium]